jgi:hypothetical protein
LLTEIDGHPETSQSRLLYFRARLVGEKTRSGLDWILPCVFAPTAIC